MAHKIIIAKDFTEYPGARYYVDGDKSGEEFYEKLLLPSFQKALNADEVLFVDIDGTNGYATSFLDQAFGALARKFGADVINKHTEIKSDDEPDLKEDIKGYINDTNKD